MRINVSSSLFGLAAIGVVFAAVTAVTPFVFRAAGDNAFIAMTIPACLLTLAATSLAERAPAKQALWLILSLGVLLRLYVLMFDPLLSSDIYRYVWDGKVQANGINPYRYFPAHDALVWLQDTAIFPRINRADYAVTIYPPVAQFFFLTATRLGENVTAMRLALLGCEAISVVAIMVLLGRLGKPSVRVVAYLWHPLPIWQIANSGHVDALMMALLLVGLWAALSSRVIAGAILLTLAALVKPFVAPVLAVVWRRWDPKLPAVVIATIALCYLPYLSVGSGVFGFLTTGYLTEEGLSSGDGFWLLSVWRLAFGPAQGDVAIYVMLAAAGLALLAFRSTSKGEPPLVTVVNANILLAAVLFVLSPNYPWYFLALTPFLALCGNAPTWVLTIGALLLTDEREWDYAPPKLIVESVLYGAFLCACAWSLWTMRTKRAA